MHDLKAIRVNPDFYRAGMKKRRVDPAVIDEILELDEKRRTVIQQVQELREKRNAMSKQVGQLKREGKDASTIIEEVRKIGDMIPELNAQVEELERKITDMLSNLPNIPHESVPEGENETDNVVVRSWGEPAAREVVPHWELGRSLGLYDPERAAKLAKSRFVLTYGKLAALERALIQFMLDIHTGEHGYTEVLPPFLVNSETMFGTGQLPKFKDDLFYSEKDDLYLIPTAEVPVTNLFRDEFIEVEKLPLKFTSYTPCFRREAGSYGRDTKGLIRVHQFNKVELVKFTLPENSYDELETLVNDAARILELLGLPYRVVLLCTGDLGFSAAKTYDLEVWLPSYNGYKEISSCSNFEDFQTRRMNIRFKRERNSKPEFVHTLNGSGLAVGRTVAAILENYQTEDGRVKIPEVLRPYMHGQEYIP